MLIIEKQQQELAKR